MSQTLTTPESTAGETTATPAPIASVFLESVDVLSDKVIVQFRPEHIADPRRVIAALFAEELERWRPTSLEWQRYVPFRQHLAEAAADLQNAEAAAAAAKQAWSEAIGTDKDVASLERNHREAALQVEIVSERAAILRAKENELKQAVESAWKERMGGVLRQRRDVCETRVRDARTAISNVTLNQIAILSIAEEMHLAMQLSLGVQGVYGLSPRWF